MIFFFVFHISSLKEAIDSIIDNDSNKFFKIKNNFSYINQPKSDNSCGSSLFYTIDGNKLIITGSGQMKNYSDYNKSPWYSFRTEILTIELPEGITSIGHYAFNQCENITFIDIPETVLSIGEDAFNRCYNLQSIIIPSKVTVIQAYTFVICRQIASIEILGNVTSIEISAFYACSCLQSLTLPESLTSITQYAFECSGIQTITIPKKVTVIEEKLFKECKNLESIEFLGDITYIESSAFIDCISLLSIVIPENVTSIGSRSFVRCESLKSIIIPSKVKVIEAFLFSSCLQIASIEILGDVTSIGDDAFHNCYCLQNFTIPENVTSIGVNAFNNCKVLSSITIPSKINIISDYLFYNCINLSSIEFYGDVLSIKDYAFCGCKNLQSIIIPENVTSIGSYAFSKCIRLRYFYYLGFRNLSINDNIFTDTPLNLVYVTEKYEDDQFCGIPVSLPSSNYFTTFNSFTNSKDISTTEYSISNNYFQTTHSISYSLSFVMKRSVSFSITNFLSNSYIIVNEDNSPMFSFTQSNYIKYLPYIIYYYSPTYIQMDLLLFNEHRYILTPEKLIGITCGSTSVFFLILAIIIFIIQKKYEVKSTEISISESFNEENQINVDKKNEIIDEKIASDESDIDFWI